MTASNTPSRQLTEGELAARRLHDNWILVGEFFSSRNWPDTRLGRAASDINADMPRILGPHEEAR